MIPGPSELILILLIVVVVFGAKRIPEIMGGLGKGIRTFKKAMDEEETPPATPAQDPTAPVSVAPPAVPPGEPAKEKTEQK
jgi:sec-independent protein translocase protein TatA